jgi:hypothetical protein
LRVFENRVQRIIFGSKRKEVTGACRNLHNEELHNLYTLPDIIRVIKSRRIRWTGHVIHVRQMNEYSILVGKSERKRLFGRLRHK